VSRINGEARKVLGSFCAFYIGSVESIVCRDAASGVMDKYLIDEIKSQFIEGIEFIPEFPPEV
jgi:hypothetical protein